MRTHRAGFGESLAQAILPGGAAVPRGQGGATRMEIAAALGISETRATQVLQQAWAKYLFWWHVHGLPPGQPLQGLEDLADEEPR